MTQSHSTPESRLIAPLWHTGLLLLVILALTLIGFYSQKHALTAAPTTSNSKILLYLSVIALQYGLLRLVTLGLRRYGNTLNSVIGGQRTDLRSIILNIVIGITFWAVCAVLLMCLKNWIGGGDTPVRGVLPNNIPQGFLWIVLSIAAGFVEEVCYRGYLQKQIMSLTHSATVAVFMQAVLFAVSHSYQGFKSVVVIFVYGTMFGLLALWRGDLWPGIVAHAWTDIVGGLVR